MSDQHKSNISELDKFNAYYLPLIEAELDKQLSNYENKDAIIKALKGGKRLRARLSMLAFKACGGTDDSKGTKTAVSAELSHSSSLIKDDILDKDKERRGQPSLWVEKGPLEAMRTSDTMLIAGLESISEFGSNVVKTFLGGWKDSWQGESEDYSIIKGLDKINGPFYELYFKVIRHKTAPLFIIATKMGAQAATAPPDIVAIMARYGEEVGLAYQIADDLVDFKKGKTELLPTLILAQMDQSFKQQILGMISQGKANIGEALMGFGVNIEQFLRTELKNSLNRINSIANGMESIDPKYKQLIIDFPTYAVKSMLNEGKIEGIID